MLHAPPAHHPLPAVCLLRRSVHRSLHHAVAAVAAPPVLQGTRGAQGPRWVAGGKHAALPRCAAIKQYGLVSRRHAVPTYQLGACGHAGMQAGTADKAAAPHPSVVLRFSNVVVRYGYVLCQKSRASTREIKLSSSGCERAGRRACYSGTARTAGSFALRCTSFPCCPGPPTHVAAGWALVVWLGGGVDAGDHRLEDGSVPSWVIVLDACGTVLHAVSGSQPADAQPAGAWSPLPPPPPFSHPPPPTPPHPCLIAAAHCQVPLPQSRHLLASTSMQLQPLPPAASPTPEHHVRMHHLVQEHHLQVPRRAQLEQGFRQLDAAAAAGPPLAHSSATGHAAAAPLHRACTQLFIEVERVVVLQGQGGARAVQQKSAVRESGRQRGGHSWSTQPRRRCNRGGTPAFQHPRTQKRACISGCGSSSSSSSSVRPSMLASCGAGELRRGAAAGGSVAARVPSALPAASCSTARALRMSLRMVRRGRGRVCALGGWRAGW